MGLWITAAVAFAILGYIAYQIMQMPDSPLRRKKRRVPPPEPPKDWQGIAERLEKRVHGMEAKLTEAEKVIRGKDKELLEKQTEIEKLTQEFLQEQTWRKKEEEAVSKEKRREKMLEDELTKARDGLNSESTQRIKLEYEVKELRTVKESIMVDVRRLSSHNIDLEKKVKSFSDENRELHRENDQLKVKKEADQWVAKDDYIRVEKLLKRSRWEVDLFKRKFAADLWPRELQMRPSKALKDEPEYGSAAVPDPDAVAKPPVSSAGVSTARAPIPASPASGSSVNREAPSSGVVAHNIPSEKESSAISADRPVAGNGAGSSGNPQVEGGDEKTSGPAAGA